MKFQNLLAGNLAKSVSRVMPSIGRPTVPILNHLLLKIENDTLTMTGTDLEVEISTVVALDGVKHSPGTMTVPARKFSDILKSLPPDAPVSLSKDKSGAVLSSGRSRFRMAVLDAGDYPAIEMASDPRLRLSLPGKSLATLIDKTSVAMASQDVRYYLNGLLLEARPDELRAAATDGHRLCLAKESIDTGVADTIRAILPRKTVLALKGELAGAGSEAVLLSLTENHIYIDTGTTVLIGKLLEGKYPDYERVIPRGKSHVVHVSTRDLRDAVQRAAILSNEKYRGGRFLFGPDVLTIQAINQDQEESEDGVAITHEGEEFEIGLRLDYVVDALGTLGSENAEIRMTDSNSSILIKSPGQTPHLSIVMPMRL